MRNVEEKPRWLMQSPNNERKKKVKGEEEREIEFIDLRFERLQVVGFRKRIRQEVP